MAFPTQKSPILATEASTKDDTSTNTSTITSTNLGKDCYQVTARTGMIVRADGSKMKAVAGILTATTKEEKDLLDYFKSIGNVI